MAPLVPTPMHQTTVALSIDTVAKEHSYIAM